MVKIEIVTGSIAGSAHAAVIRNTFLKGGEEEMKALENAGAAITAEGPAWTEENREKPAQLFQCYRAVLREAADKGFSVLDLAAVPAGECGSELFQAATQAMRAVKAHCGEADLPQVIRFLCPSEESANMYKTAYNYWLATDHDTRMEVPHRHE